MTTILEQLVEEMKQMTQKFEVKWRTGIEDSDTLFDNSYIVIWNGKKVTLYGRSRDIYFWNDMSNGISDKYHYSLILNMIRSNNFIWSPLKMEDILSFINLPKIDN